MMSIHDPHFKFGLLAIYTSSVLLIYYCSIVHHIVDTPVCEGVISHCRVLPV